MAILIVENLSAFHLNFLQLVDSILSLKGQFFLHALYIYSVLKCFILYTLLINGLISCHI